MIEDAAEVLGLKYKNKEKPQEYQTRNDQEKYRIIKEIVKIENNIKNSLNTNVIIKIDDKFKNVKSYTIELDEVFKSFQLKLSDFDSKHGLANSRARIRMTTLYQIAAANNGIVVGTGNKVEDFGVGFYTKYGDGGVDILPIADCTKSEVWELGKELGILDEIISAQPTDGLWDDGRTDVGQLGLTYQELEEAMANPNSPNRSKYLEKRKLNLHKMGPIPICKIPN